MDDPPINTHDSQPISVGEWVLYLFLISIPFVNLIVLCIWAFGDEPNATKANFAKAYLIWIVVGVAVGLLLMYLVFGMLFTFSPFETIQRV